MLLCCNCQRTATESKDGLSQRQRHAQHKDLRTYKIVSTKVKANNSKVKAALFQMDNEHTIYDNTIGLSYGARDFKSSKAIIQQSWVENL